MNLLIHSDFVHYFLLPLSICLVPVVIILVIIDRLVSDVNRKQNELDEWYAEELAKMIIIKSCKTRESKLTKQNDKN